MTDDRPPGGTGGDAAGPGAGTADGDGRIRRLPRATVERIAAGEVVTRPARVVGELLDNALDAGATRIEVAVRGDGTDLIRVADDGRGMSRAGAALAVRRHATSKLGDGERPAAATTLGFRGEALAAIAEAGRLELVTNDGGPTATRVRVGERRTADGGSPDGERPVTTADASRGRGTTVTVRDLFADRPARRESLAAPATEFGRIADLVARYALARPGIAFTLSHDDAETLSTPGTGRRDALMAVYDRRTASRSTSFTHDTTVDAGPDGGTSLRAAGVLVYPSITRAGRDHVRVSVNGRPVDNPRLKRAARDGYGSLLPDGREPVAAVDVSLPAGAVDPNVHPAKREVGLRAGDAVADAVEAGVGDALTGADLRRAADVATDVGTALSPVGDADGDRSRFGDVEPIGQFRELYLLCDAGDELLVVDQHAAHERVNYERLDAALADASVPSVPVDPPETLSPGPAAAAAADAHADTLDRLGFDVEPFGGDLLRFRAVPAPFGRAADADALRDALDALAGGERPRDLRADLLRDLACHPSLKAGDSLDRADARRLLDRLGECERPFACPHGRPTVLSVDAATLAAGFDRGGGR